MKKLVALTAVCLLALYVFKAEAAINIQLADVDKDGGVSILDLSIVAGRLGTNDIRYDYDEDGQVSILDISLQQQYFGQTYTPTPTHFCQGWSGGFCADYRRYHNTAEMPFPNPEDGVSLDCLSSTVLGYNPTMFGGNLPMPCGFAKNSHFMTRMEDGDFGLVLLRQQRPFDIAGREGHVRFQIDLKTTDRRYLRFIFSPTITKTATDDREMGNPPPQAPKSSLDVWLINGRANILCNDSSGYNSCFQASGNTYFGSDDVGDIVDIYTTRTRTKVYINSTLFNDYTHADIGFDRGYIYLAQASYNPCKTWEMGGPIENCQNPWSIFHWDDVAYDGPTLVKNDLVPVGYQDVAFNVYGATSCSVAGVSAVQSGAPNGYVWMTWVARMTTQVVTTANVSCSGTEESGFPFWNGVVRGFEVVKR